MSSSKCIIISCCTVAVRPYIILVLLWSSDVTGVAAPLAIWHNEQWGGRSLIDPFQIVSALQDSLTFCKGQTFINPMVLIQSTPLCPPCLQRIFVRFNKTSGIFSPGRTQCFRFLKVITWLVVVQCLGPA